MKFLYILSICSLFNVATSQNEFVSSNVRLMPVSKIPNIYADAPSQITEMQVNEQIDLTTASAKGYNKMTGTAEVTRNRSYSNKKNKSYPKL